MATGALSGGVCFESVSQAADNYFSKIPPSSYFNAADGFSYTTTYTNSAGVWSSQVTQSTPFASSVISSTLAVVPNFVVCESPSESFNSGAQIGFAFVLVLSISYGFVTLKKALF